MVCEAYSQSDFSFLLGETHMLDISEANENGYVTGKMTAFNQPSHEQVWYAQERDPAEK